MGAPDCEPLRGGSAGGPPSTTIRDMPKSRSKRRPRQPPPKPKPKQSPLWVGVLFFLLLGCGVVVLIGNYVGVFGGDAANWRLWYGLGLVSAAFLVATKWQ